MVVIKEILPYDNNEKSESDETNTFINNIISKA